MELQQLQMVDAAAGGAEMTDAQRTAETIVFRSKRLRVCLLCLWYMRHWPMNDISEAEWREQLEGETAWSAFLEGWCRE